MKRYLFLSTLVCISVLIHFIALMPEMLKEIQAHLSLCSPAWHLFKSFVRTLFPHLCSQAALSRLWFEFHVSRWSDCLIA